MWPNTVNFVVTNYAPFAELNDKLPEDLTPYFEQCLSLQDAWITQTFIFLKSAGYNVKLQPKLVPGEICFIESSTLGIKDWPFRSYVVACRADRPRCMLSNQCTVMNKLAVGSPNEHHMYSWPQPVITKRNPTRGNEVKIVDFKGALRNLWEPFREKSFEDKLNQLDLTLKVNTEATVSGVDLYRSWGDYSETDILLAVRNLTEYDFSIKPELKLTNAWRAGVPAVLGPEPAFQDLRKSELDFIEVNSVEGAVQAIEKLKNDPALYQAMVENGLKRAEEFSVENLTKNWVDLIEGPIFSGFHKWSSHNWLYAHTSRLAMFAINIIRDKQEVRSHFSKVLNGPRPLTDS